MRGIEQKKFFFGLSRISKGYDVNTGGADKMTCSVLFSFTFNEQWSSILIRGSVPRTQPTQSTTQMKNSLFK